MKHWKKLMGGLGFVILILLIIHIVSPRKLFGLLIPDGTYLHYFDTKGDELWQKHYSKGVYRSIISPDSSVIVQFWKSGFTCFETNGDERWSYNPQQQNGNLEYLFNSNDLVFFKLSNDQGAELQAITEAGELVWVYDLGERAIPYVTGEDVCVSGDFIYAAEQRVLHRIDLNGKGEAVFEIPKQTNKSEIGPTCKLVPSGSGNILLWRDHTLFSVGKAGLKWTYTLPSSRDNYTHVSAIRFAAVGDSVYLNNVTSREMSEKNQMALIHLDSKGKEVSRRLLQGYSSFLRGQSKEDLFLLSSSGSRTISQLDSRGNITQLTPPTGAENAGLVLGIPHEIQEMIEFESYNSIFLLNGEPMVIGQHHPNFWIKPVGPEFTETLAGQAALRLGEFPSYYLKAVRQQKDALYSNKVISKIHCLGPSLYFAPNGCILAVSSVKGGHGLEGS